ncbi:hypothetical protein L211DRAFT_840366 [Terfezia boudieri ATCC MYA-4762]|uniref:Uncharacterized protein n=1 Tax=Terfezia boudieri ATCC MYA-4762 TaxID=1051890 RepID=A0A3N4L872_9PEZI|nr:hypothetical protein L211DRAFT_844204 [Terfezia boudieri ATCC MYA-4762]RPB21741.1 hypothetical protein L211DRAFT_840366 [Terfezia boudieri ATCC MYA-4762]
MLWYLPTYQSLSLEVSRWRSATQWHRAEPGAVRLRAAVSFGCSLVRVGVNGYNNEELVRYCTCTGTGYVTVLRWLVMPGAGILRWPRSLGVPEGPGPRPRPSPNSRRIHTRFLSM